MEFIDSVSIRPYDSTSDEAFLYSTWMKSYKESGWGRAIPAPIYNIEQRHRIDRLLAREDTWIVVAANSDTPEHIYGWMVGEGNNTIHYIYVKHPYRGAGVANKLISQLGGTHLLYTHRPSPIWVEAKLKEDDRFSNWIYNPYCLERTNVNN
jgi:GNAT superfamily N-acetyltransferase